MESSQQERKVERYERERGKRRQDKVKGLFPLSRWRSKKDLDAAIDSLQAQRRVDTHELRGSGSAFDARRSGLKGTCCLRAVYFAVHFNIISVSLMNTYR